MGHTKNFERQQLIYAEQPFLEHQVFLSNRANKHLLRYIFCTNIQTIQDMSDMVCEFFRLVDADENHKGFH